MARNQQPMVDFCLLALWNPSQKKRILLVAWRSLQTFIYLSYLALSYSVHATFLLRPCLYIYEYVYLYMYFTKGKLRVATLSSAVDPLEAVVPFQGGCPGQRPSLSIIIPMK